MENSQYEEYSTTPGDIIINSTSDYNETVCNETIDDCFVVSNPRLQLAYDILIPTILAIIMLAMGAGITLQEIKQRLKPPIAPLMGLLSQFIIMPALAFGMAHALSMEAHHAIGLMVVASCPGGTVSNIFTLWSLGDLPLRLIWNLLHNTEYYVAWSFHSLPHLIRHALL